MKKAFAAIWGSVGSRVWLIVTAVLVVLCVVIGVIASTTFYTTICSFLGGRQTVYADDDSQGLAYVADEGYGDKSSSIASGNAVNERITDEGMVLLKNASALPLAEGARISVFGKNSVEIAYGGTGSGGGDYSDADTLYDSLTAAGFQTNPDLKAFYENDGLSGPGRSDNPDIENAGVSSLDTGETPVSAYDDDLKGTFSSYGDAALVLFTRISGEGWDLPASEYVDDDGRLVARHYLALDRNERDLLDMVCDAGFDHVIVLINSANAMELGFLENEDDESYHEEIDGAILVGLPGSSGIMSLGRILKGEVTPSGHTVDTYVSDLTADPSYANFGNNGQNGSSNVYTSDGEDSGYRFVDYEEGIYVGYRYYETRGAADPDWYDDAVVYPMGYGLSYTTFEYSLVTEDASPLTRESFTVEAEVLNTGETYSGKAVVQVYASAPYTRGGVAKADKVLVGFAKTDLIEPGGSDKVEIEIDPYYLASYDYSGANDNGHKGYELESGTYTFYVSTNAHDSFARFEKTLSEDIVYDIDPVTENPVENRYSSDDLNASDFMLDGVMSRDDWTGTWPTSPSVGDREASDELIAALDDRGHNNPDTDKYTALPTLGAALPVIETVTEEDGTQTEIYLQLKNLAGAPYGDERWDALLDSLTIEQMNTLVLNGAFNTAAIEHIGKPLTTDSDGPVGWVNFMVQGFVPGCAYASECLIAQTWNVDLAYDMGVSVGNESLIGSGSVMYTGWYAPAMNIHRSAFGGRNFEYYGEDPFFSGKMAANVIAGAKTKGVITYIKHFAVNEQEPDRDTQGLVTWVTEQAMREIYLRPFEIAVKEGGTLGVMSSFNRIGTRWTGGDYRLLTEILRNEWGFEGAVICDFNSSSYMNTKQMAYAGGDLNLANTPMRTREWAENDSPEDINILRNCTRNILFATANSNAINRDVKGYILPVWQIVMIAVMCAIAVGLAVWGVFAIRGALRKKTEGEAQTPAAE